MRWFRPERRVLIESKTGSSARCCDWASHRTTLNLEAPVKSGSKKYCCGGSSSPADSMRTTVTYLAVSDHKTTRAGFFEYVQVDRADPSPHLPQ